MQKKTVEGNVGGKWSEKKMEGEDGLRTVECLRGRLVAERVTSRNAKEEAEQMENKLIELEDQLKEEIKSRKRAEKKLKFLMKKLESLNISYVSDGSEQSGSLEKSEVTSVSSTASSITKEAEDKEPNAQRTSGSTKCHIQGSMKNNQNVPRISKFIEYVSPADEETLSSASEAGSGELMTPKCHSEDSSEKTNSSMASNNFEQSLPQITKFNQGRDCPAIEETYNSSGDTHSERSSELESSGHSHDSKTDDYILTTSIEDEEINGDNSQGHDHCVDNSMALVPVDLPRTEQTINPAVLDAPVKEVLDSLQRAKVKLQISMEQRSMMKVG